jgi:hypothetical protein
LELHWHIDITKGLPFGWNPLVSLEEDRHLRTLHIHMRTTHPISNISKDIAITTLVDGGYTKKDAKTIRKRGPETYAKALLSLIADNMVVAFFGGTTNPHNILINAIMRLDGITAISLVEKRYSNVAHTNPPLL